MIIEAILVYLILGLLLVLASIRGGSKPTVVFALFMAVLWFPLTVGYLNAQRKKRG